MIYQTFLNTTQSVVVWKDWTNSTTILPIYGEAKRKGSSFGSLCMLMCSVAPNVLGDWLYKLYKTLYVVRL